MATTTTTTTQQPDGTPAKPGLRKPMFVKVESLKPGTNGHTLVVKVLSSNTVLNKKPRHSMSFRGPQNQNTSISECLVGDETGTILFTARNDQGPLSCSNNFFCILSYLLFLYEIMHRVPNEEIVDNKEDMYQSFDISVVSNYHVNW